MLMPLAIAAMLRTIDIVLVYGGMQIDSDPRRG